MLPLPCGAESSHANLHTVEQRQSFPTWTKLTALSGFLVSTAFINLFTFPSDTPPKKN